MPAARPAPEIRDLQVFAPPPGSAAVVAYFVIANNSDRPIRLRAVSSPQFERVEMHETTVADGVARMRPLGAVTVAPGSTLAFSRGGKHLMLSGGSHHEEGTEITLSFHYDENATIVANTTLRSR